MRHRKGGVSNPEIRWKDEKIKAKTFCRATSPWPLGSFEVPQVDMSPSPKEEYIALLFQEPPSASTPGCRVPNTGCLGQKGSWRVLVFLPLDLTASPMGTG